MRYLLSILAVVILYSVGVGQVDSSKTISAKSSVTKEPVTLKEVEYGSSDETLDDFINDNIKSEMLKYIRKNNLDDKIFAQLTISDQGMVKDVKVLNSDDSLVNEEVIRILKLSSWNPAVINGKKVSRRILVPITFSY